MHPSTATTTRAASDTIALLYPCDRSGLRTGVHPGKTYSVTKDTAYDIEHLHYQAVPLTFRGVRAMHAALVAAADEGLAFAVRGQRAHNGKYIRRLKTPRGPCPAGLKSVPLYCLALDCDKWPNLGGFDPRNGKAEAEDAWRWMRSILGPEFAGLTMSAHWTSSCCARTPAWQSPLVLSARFWLWMDTPLDEVAARALLKRISKRVQAYFAPHGHVWKKMTYAVDPKVADCQQPVYLARPKFEAGETNPLPGQRHALLVGKSNILDVAACLAGLPDLAPAKAPKSPPTGKPVAANRLPKARASVHGAVVPMAAAGRELAALRAACAAAVSGGDNEAYLAACTQLYHRRVALEMLALAAHRGGLSEGCRNNYSLMIASAVVASLPLTLTVAAVRAEVRALLRLVVSDEWLAAEWEGNGDSSVIARYEAAVRGEKGLDGKDPRYTYYKARLLEEWQPTQEEVDTLGLQSLLSGAQRAASRRAKAKAIAMHVDTAWEAKAKALAPVAHRLRAAGQTLRAVSLELGVPETTVRRLLKTPAVTVIELAATAKGVISNEIPVTMRRPVTSEDGQQVTAATWSGRPAATAAVVELRGRGLRRAA